MSARHPIIDRALAPDAPLPIRLAVARGTVPVPRPALLPALVRMLSDAETQIVEAARATLDALSEEDLQQTFSDPETEPTVIDHLLVNRELTGPSLLAALTHPQASDGALCAVAGSDREEALTILLTNQERLIRAPSILESLSANPHLTVDHRRILEDFREQFFREAPGAPSAAAEAPGPVAEAPPGTGVVSEEELQALLQEVGDLPFLSVDLGALLESQGMSADLEGIVEGDSELRTAWQRLRNLNGVERLKVALRGGREERALLVRDRNRIIASAVLRNPRVTDMEVETFAALKSVSQDILRMIGSKREWMRNLSIVKNLVRNPKTPPGISMNHVNRLGTRDLKLIMHDHNVPDIVRRNARRHIELRESKPAQARGRH